MDEDIHDNQNERQNEDDDPELENVQSELELTDDDEGEEFDEDEQFYSDNGEEFQMIFEPRESDNDEEQPIDNEVNLDRNLAGMHSYLNKDMEQLFGRVILEADTEIDLFLFWWPNVILVPGQKLPLQVPADRADIFIRAKETNRIIGFIASPSEGSSLNDCVGTTGEMMSIKTEDSAITAMVIGRQRFITLSVRRCSDNNLQGKVRILSEISEQSYSTSDSSGRHCAFPLQNTIPGTWRRSYGASSTTYHNSVASSLPSNQVLRFTEPQQDQRDDREGAQRQINNNGSLLSKLMCGYSFRRGQSSPGATLDDHSNTRSRQSQYNSSGNVGDSEMHSIEQVPLIPVRGNSMALLCSNQSTWISKNDCDWTATSNLSNDDVALSIGPITNQIKSSNRIPARRDVYAAVAHTFGRWPSWVYESYDVERLIAQIVEELRQWNSTWHLDQWTRELAVQFSYWLLQNLPVTDDEKIRLLKLDHVVYRLQACLQLLAKCSEFLCKSCHREITHKTNIICLANEGSLQTFVNPHGHLHEMLTVNYAQHFSRIGPTTREYSWFPGYSWTIIQCDMCHSHLGWMFTASKSSLKPKTFYGICRSAVVPRFSLISDSSAGTATNRIYLAD